MPKEQYVVLSEEPKGLKSLFIQLSGAHPAAFRYLPEHEASEYAKTGATLLIPFLLAVTAGTFTLYSLQTNKNQMIAVCGGFLWAVVILVIDMAVMTQLIKMPPPVESAAEERRRAIDRTKPVVQVEDRGDSKWHNRIIALLRMSVAVVLGLVMSHSLVLLVFKDRVAQKIALKRIEMSKALGAERGELRDSEDRLNEAVSVLSAPDASFLVRFDQWLQRSLRSTPNSAGDSQTPAGSPDSSKAEASPFANDLRISGLQTRLTDLLNRQREELANLKSKRNLAADDARKYASDLTLAKKMEAAETDGQTQDFTFSTPEFVQALGKSTSGIKSKGSRATKIGDFVNQWLGTVKAMGDDVQKLDAQIAIVSAKQEAERKQYESQLESAKDDWLKRVESESAQAANQYTLRVETARKQLQEDIAVLRVNLDRARAALQGKENAFETDSHDPLEQTQALLGVIFDHSGNDGILGEMVVLTMVVLVLLSVMLIDLTPLMIKYLKPAGAYDNYVHVQRRVRLTPVSPGFSETAGPRGAAAGDGGGPKLPRRQGVSSSSMQEPPPPPPRYSPRER